MKLLLDTHCLIWLLTDAPQLDRAVRKLIAGAQSVWFSDASVWELWPYLTAGASVLNNGEWNRSER